MASPEWKTEGRFNMYTFKRGVRIAVSASFLFLLRTGENKELSSLEKRVSVDLRRHFWCSH